MGAYFKFGDFVVGLLKVYHHEENVSNRTMQTDARKNLFGKAKQKKWFGIDRRIALRHNSG
jgi:hypothetical protein